MVSDDTGWAIIIIVVIAFIVAVYMIYGRTTPRTGIEGTAIRNGSVGKENFTQIPSLSRHLMDPQITSRMSFLVSIMRGMNVA